MVDLIIGGIVLIVIGNAAHATWKQAKKGGCAGCSCSCEDSSKCGQENR